MAIKIIEADEFEAIDGIEIPVDRNNKWIGYVRVENGEMEIEEFDDGNDND